MQVTLKSKNRKLTPAEDEAIRRKLDRLPRYLEQISEAEVIVGSERPHRGGDQGVVQLTVRANGTLLRAEEKDPDSILSFYKQLLKLRHGNKEIRDGTYVPINQNDQNVLSYLRVREDQAVLVSLNLSASPQKVNYELKKNGFASAKPLVTSGKSSSTGDFVSLDAYGVFIGQLMR